MREKAWIVAGAIFGLAALAGTARRLLSFRRGERQEPRRTIDEVEEAGLESFPASDPPSWTLGDRDEA